MTMTNAQAALIAANSLPREEVGHRGRAALASSYKEWLDVEDRRDAEERKPKGSDPTWGDTA